MTRVMHLSPGWLVAAVLAAGCGGGSPDAPEPESPPAGKSAAGQAAAGGSAGMSEKEKARTEPYPNDAGSDVIDVSGYSAEMKANYEVFKQCANCHTLARPINSQFHDDATWKRYVKRMIRKPGCGISNEDGKKIYEFLVYDSQKRKIARKAAFKAERRKLLERFEADHPERYHLLFEDRSPEAEVGRELPGW